jgi:type I restriction-modification system DNA methylase subunit
MISKDEAYNLIRQLVERFGEQLESYISGEYNETLTRRDFIDPFFKALGWDVDNTAGNAEAYREVIHEDRVKVGRATKAPDYAFRLPGGRRLYFVEAKKPSVVVKNDISVAYQVRRYGWNAKLALSIVTDFEEFAVYDCTIKPHPNDKPGKARIKYLRYDHYLSEFDFLWETFSFESVRKGRFDRYAQNDSIKKGATTVDHEFLISLNNWRIYLATAISLKNKHLNEDEINFAVQQIIDRLIFLRIAEDRGVEPYGLLRESVIYAFSKKEGGAFRNLMELFRKADEKYNAGLFDFKRDRVTENLVIDHKVLKTIITEMYFPESPYEFSEIPVEIMGSAYEQFLGKQIKIDLAHRASIEEKPEVRKAGGVYYTPQYIVDYIVKNTVGKMIEGKSPAEISVLKIVDPACGSGSFLLGAYRYLLDYHRNYYTENGTKTGKKESPVTPFGELTSAEKKRILLNNIYGVDIDVNAVEVTKLSLLIKCLEGETQTSIEQQYKLWHERILPTLDNNIKCGNSLVDEDFYDGVIDFDPTQKSVKPFNWQKAFPQVFTPRPPVEPDDVKILVARLKHVQKKADEIILKLGGKSEDPAEQYGNDIGFDVVIGNPPYVRQESLGSLKKYYENKYRVYHGMADLYSYFIERGFRLLSRKGLYGMIVANKWMRAAYGEPLRRFLQKQTVEQIVDFGDLPVFEAATAYPCILIAHKGATENNTIESTTVRTLSFGQLDDYVLLNRQETKQESLDDAGWNLAGEVENNLMQKIKNTGIPLGEYVKGKILRGVLTGLNEAFIINKETKDKLVLEDPKSAEAIKSILAGKDIKRYQTPEISKFLILFPRRFTNQTGDFPQSGWEWFEENYPAIANYLKPFREKAEKRFDKGEYWWELRACDYYIEFEKPKIMLPDIALSMKAAYDNSGCYCLNTAYIIPVDDKKLLGIINSKLVHYFYSGISNSIRGGYLRFIRQYLEQIPIPELSKADYLDNLVELYIQLNEKLKSARLPDKIEQLQNRIDHTNKRIDQLVYGLYGLNNEEIELVEKNVKI